MSQNKTTKVIPMALAAYLPAVRMGLLYRTSGWSWEIYPFQNRPKFLRRISHVRRTQSQRRVIWTPDHAERVGFCAGTSAHAHPGRQRLTRTLRRGVQRNHRPRSGHRRAGRRGRRRSRAGRGSGRNGVGRRAGYRHSALCGSLLSSNAVRLPGRRLNRHGPAALQVGTVLVGLAGRSCATSTPRH